MRREEALHAREVFLAECVRKRQTTVIRDFGLHSAIAVLTAFVAVMLVVPCYLSFLPFHAVLSDQRKEKKIFDQLHRLVQNRPRMVAFSVVFLTILTGVYGSSVRPNSHLLEMYNSEHPTHNSIKHLEIIINSFDYEVN